MLNEEGDHFLKEGDLLKPKNEKQAIEYYTALHFLNVYNKMFKTHYQITELSDIPDVICKDGTTDKNLYLEITLHEEMKGEIPFLLGKTKKKPIPREAKNNTKNYEDHPLFILVDIINKKLLKDYGKNVALVVRQVSYIRWDYNIEQIKKLLDLKTNPFDQGIWILTVDSKIIRVI